MRVDRAVGGLGNGTELAGHCLVRVLAPETEVGEEESGPRRRDVGQDEDVGALDVRDEGGSAFLGDSGRQLEVVGVGSEVGQEVVEQDP